MTAILPTVEATTALVTAMRAGMPAGVAVYDARVPPNATYPYLFIISVSYPAQVEGSHGDPESDIELAYSFEAVGTARIHAQAVADRARTILMDRDPLGEFKRAITVQGWKNADRRTQYGVGAIEREGDRQNEVFVQRSEYVLNWTPA